MKSLEQNKCEVFNWFFDFLKFYYFIWLGLALNKVATIKLSHIWNVWIINNNMYLYSSTWVHCCGDYRDNIVQLILDNRIEYLSLFLFSIFEYFVKLIWIDFVIFLFQMDSSQVSITFFWFFDALLIICRFLFVIWLVFLSPVPFVSSSIRLN